ncbi:hypothetical protein EK21DRAFT_66538 [Setomelanomma holmii]|uniref:F-box domain-containing protein n=1 Tax=Setomelanomma holmii TaxID=210430 RepID=A0A9P4H969_9PLEO|nr:hypothetical protein EK21DRAFT_66538 [Setomelanomma holmii]
MSDSSDSDARASSLLEHEENCPHHDDARNGLCYALTYSKNLCKCRAKITEPGYLPVCKTHSVTRSGYWQTTTLRAGKCQAIEDCGNICNRLSKDQPPFHLCLKHQRGSDTLPCHLLRLPTELRLMVFRYLFPDKINPYTSKVNGGILHVNSQIYQEASSVLYDEHCFEVTVNDNSIHLQGKHWTREPNTRNKADSYTVGAMLCQPGAARIRKLDISIMIGGKSRAPKCIGSRGITHEDYNLYIYRDSVRKLVELLTESSPSESLAALKTLTVMPSISLGHRWTYDEAAVALFFVLEPLQALHGVQQLQTRKIYTKLRQQWLDALKDAEMVPFVKQRFPADTSRSGYRKIETFTQLIHLQSTAPIRSWMSNVFHNLERPLHLARVAYENHDDVAIASIHEAIKLRWINAHRQQQQSLRTVADSINTMFEDDTHEEAEDEGDGRLTPRELFPDAFEFEAIEPLKQPYTASQTNMWTELKVEDTTPKRGEPGVTVQDRGMWRIIRKGGKEWVRLMTPAEVRRIQAEKAAKSQA